MQDGVVGQFDARWDVGGVEDEPLDVFLVLVQPVAFAEEAMTNWPVDGTGARDELRVFLDASFVSLLGILDDGRPSSVSEE
ncbi:hypothetical protein ABZ876_29680 [Streptomyces sp. NPDC046931]|uniref:hypothetical protein n=1 Tax=Streptomyces sp. NPDC046931 TaxID=3154806 RepID=UPI003411337A